jgi:hypothetical protein
MAIIISNDSNIVSINYDFIAYTSGPTPGVEAPATAQAKKAS